MSESSRGYEGPLTARCLGQILGDDCGRNTFDDAGAWMEVVVDGSRAYWCELCWRKRGGQREGDIVIGPWVRPDW
jgi:hypothetical protein